MAGEDFIAVCGKVGGFGKYGDAFGPLGAASTAWSRARPQRLATSPASAISFVRDGDATDLCAAPRGSAGMREALMARVVRFYRREQPDLPDASGHT